MSALHLRDMRLYINAGMAFPACKASAKLLDVDEGRLPTTNDHNQVTCKRCLDTVRVTQRASDMLC